MKKPAPIDPRVHQLKAVNRLIAAQEARDRLLPFMLLTMPDPTDVEDAKLSRYEITPQARLLCEIMEKVERGELKRVCVSIGPQLGKSQILSRGAPAWIAGRNPYRNMILGSYNQDFANEFGFEVRNIIETAAYKQVFPDYKLMKGGTAKDLLVSEEGGKLAFVGVGGSGTGKPADLFVVDDPFRNDEDANSATYREKVYKWFTSTVFSRTTDKTAIVIVHTRWHQDDLIGRLCDPSHPERDGLYKGIAKRWTYINIPAVVEDPQLAKALGLTLEKPTDPDILEQFGQQPMSALWPGRKSLPLLAEAKQSDPRTFNALYMGKPAPEQGEYFKADYILEYDRRDLPKRLRMYGASDHAVSKKQRRDYTALGCVGIDENDEIWVMPDLVWRRMETDKTVEELLGQFKIHRPQLWWLENEMISKSFGPFLRKRMIEDKIYTTLDPITPASDLETRARSIQGRMAMQMVHFPKFAPWWQNARTQILTFPYATNDDFVSWLALVGLGLIKELKPASEKKQKLEPGKPGSIEWILRAAEQTMRKQTRENTLAGW
jgi:predicted phage terminase large subunit-like protein